MKYCFLPCLLLILFLARSATGQARDSAIHADTLVRAIQDGDNDTDSSEPSVIRSQNDYLWLMGNFSLDLGRSVSTVKQSIAGISWKVAGIWHSYALTGMLHEGGGPTGGDLAGPTDEHHSDYAIMLGVSHRTRPFFLTFNAGLSWIDFTKNGTAIPSKDSALLATYQKVTGSTFGVSCGLNAYVTPFPFWGIWGLGIYGCLAGRQSYLVVEVSLLELNIPFALGRKDWQLGQN